jgi:acyl-CoA synthetase (AMP-forming)/AMP-acid ligase II
MAVASAAGDPTPAMPGDSPSLDDLAAFCAARLAPYKRPSRFVLCESLPATPTGKVLKHRLTSLARPLPS